MSSQLTISGGYILLARRLFESEMMGKPPLYFKLWGWMLARAMWKDGDRLQRGQLVTSISEMQQAMSYRVGWRRVVPTKDEIRSAYEAFYDHTGTVNTENLLRTFHKAATERGVTHFVIDSLMKCGIAEDDYNAQKALVDRLQNFAQKDTVHVHLVAHSRKKNNEDDAPGKMDVKGSGAITDLADNVFSVWRNKGKETKVQQLTDTRQTVPDELRNKPDAVLDCSKHRELGGDAEGRYGLYYHRASMQFIERPGDLPTFYFEA